MALHPEHRSRGRCALWDDAVGGSVAVDAIISIGKFSRVHADVSFCNGVGSEALYDFIYRPLGEEVLHYYIGAGPFILFDDPFKFGFSGEFGLEYKFASVPIVQGTDWRLSFIIIENTDLMSEVLGLISGMYWAQNSREARLLNGIVNGSVIDVPLKI